MYSSGNKGDFQHLQIFFLNKIADREHHLSYNRAIHHICTTQEKPISPIRSGALCIMLHIYGHYIKATQSNDWVGTAANAPELTTNQTCTIDAMHCCVAMDHINSNPSLFGPWWLSTWGPQIPSTGHFGNTCRTEQGQYRDRINIV